MKIGSIDEKNRVLVSFDRPVTLKLFSGKRRLEPSGSVSGGLTRLNGMTNENEGAELFRVAYEPSNRSAKY